MLTHLLRRILGMLPLDRPASEGALQAGRVEWSIPDLNTEFIEASLSEPSRTVIHTAAPVGILSGQIGQMSPAEVARASGLADVIGSEFFATHQLRTPLRILLRHGEIHRDMHRTPPVIATEL